MDTKNVSAGDLITLTECGRDYFSSRNHIDLEEPVCLIVANKNDYCIIIKDMTKIDEVSLLIRIFSDEFEVIK